MRKVAMFLAACGLMVGTAHAQPVLNGNYASEGIGTANGQPVTEISRWTFNQNQLVGFSQAINWGGQLTSTGGQPENSDGESPGFCDMTLASMSTSELNGQILVDVEMSTGGCPFPHNHSGMPQMTGESYKIYPVNGGSEFVYSEAGVEEGFSPVPNSVGYPISIAGRASKFRSH